MAHIPSYDYNFDFTDDDAAALVHNYAGLASQPQNCYHPCHWTVNGNGEVCGLLVLGHEFSEHLRTIHGVVGSDKTLLRCYWTGCFAEMKKESLMRHIQERHLEWRYTCPVCAERFTRHHTREQHVSRKHSPN